MSYNIKERPIFLYFFIVKILKYDNYGLNITQMLKKISSFFLTNYISTGKVHNQHFGQLEFQSNCLLKRAQNIPPLLLKTSWFSNSSSSKYQGNVKKIVSCWPVYRHGQWTWTWTGSLAWDWKWQGGRSCRENVSRLEMSESGVVTNITIILL